MFQLLARRLQLRILDASSCHLKFHHGVVGAFIAVLTAEANGRQKRVKNKTCQYSVPAVCHCGDIWVHGKLSDILSKADRVKRREGYGHFSPTNSGDTRT